MKTIEYRYGSYVLKCDYREGFCQVSMNEISQLRFPLLWSVPMDFKQAYSAIKVFEATGYFDIVEGANV